MVTYPSTHGVFEETIKDICRLIHENGGQVYMDGANMNAQVGLCRPGDIGADVCHLNLHKTFCIPHGGGGPGMGPIGVAEHLVAHLPTHPVATSAFQLAESAGLCRRRRGGLHSADLVGLHRDDGTGWTDARDEGRDPQRQLHRAAVCKRAGTTNCCMPASTAWSRTNASSTRPFKSWQGRCRRHRQAADRLRIPSGRRSRSRSLGTLMVEPTESEPKVELDRFIDALIAIREEIREIETGEADRENNLLKNAPHPLGDLLAEGWDRPYSRERAGFPTPATREHKVWPPVGRIDAAFGDRNLVCTCPPVEAYATV
jgi:glycine dehydrogenase